MSAGVLIVDDDPDVRVLLRLWIEDSAEDLRVVGEVGGAEEAIALLDTLAPDVVLLDLRMPDVDGLQAAERILARRPGQRLVLCSGAVDRDLEDRARAAGFHACVPKDDYERLPRAIAEAARAPRH